SLSNSAHTLGRADRAGGAPPRPTGAPAPPRRRSGPLPLPWRSTGDRRIGRLRTSGPSSWVARDAPERPVGHATIPAMPTDARSTPADDRFDDLAQRLGGFYLSWIVYLGLELGLFERIRASADGIGPAELATAAGCAPAPVEAWVRAAHA